MSPFFNSKKKKPAPSQILPPRQLLEALEPRIAPAGLLKESGFTSTAVGTPILLEAGEGLSTANAGGRYLLYVEAGQALVFTTDLNADNDIDYNEITGIAAGKNLKLISFVDINGDIVTNLKDDGTLTDSDGDARNGLDGKIVLNHRIDSITMRSVTDADLDLEQQGNTVANRRADTSYSIHGSILAGGGLGTSQSFGLTIDTAGSDTEGLLPQIGFIKTGTATGKTWFNFGSNVADGSAEIDDPRYGTLTLRGETTAFVPQIGQSGGDILGVRSGIGIAFTPDGKAFNPGKPLAVAPKGFVFTAEPYTLMGIQSGEGGIGARGGDIIDITLNGDVGGLKVISGRGGDGEQGDRGGDIRNFTDLGSLTSQVTIRTGDGGEGFLTASGRAGVLAMNTMNLDGITSVGLGDGGNALGNAGAGTSLPSGVITKETGAGNMTPVKLVGAYRETGSISRTAATDFDGDGISDIVSLFSSPDRLFVELSTGGRTYLDNISYSALIDEGDAPGSSAGIVVQDFDGDGNLDIVTASSYYQNFTGLLAYLGDGQGGFSEPRFSPLPMAQSSNQSSWGPLITTDLVSLDYDNNGEIDLAAIIRNESAGETQLVSLKNVGNGYFFVDYGKASNAATKNPYWIRTPEVESQWVIESLSTGDARYFPNAQEAVVYAQSDESTNGVISIVTYDGSQWLSLGSTKATVADPTGVSTTLLPNWISAVDLNGDLQFDIIASNSDSVEFTDTDGQSYELQISTLQGTVAGSFASNSGALNVGPVNTAHAIVGGIFALDNNPKNIQGSYIKDFSQPGAPTLANSGLVNLAATTVNGGNPNASVQGLAWSGDGSKIAFTSEATNILALVDGELVYPPEGVSVQQQIYVQNKSNQAVGPVNTIITSGGTQLVTQRTITLPDGSREIVYGNAPSTNTQFNPVNSSQIVFQTDATNLVDDDVAGSDILLKNLAIPGFVRVSSNDLGGSGSGSSIKPVFSNSGKYVAFQSNANNLVSNNVGLYTSAFFDSNSSTYHVAYFDKTLGQIKYATGSGGAWATPVVVDTISTDPDDPARDERFSTSIAVDGTGKVFVSYYDIDEKDLNVAELNGSTWSIREFASADDDGRYNALAIDASTSDVGVAFYNSTQGDLEFVSNAAGIWSAVTTIDGQATGNAGQYVSLAAADGVFHTSYFNATGGQLWYAQSAAGAGWTTKVVDSGQNADESISTTGLYTSIALAIDSTVGISYFDQTKEAVRFAKSDLAGVFALSTIVAGVGDEAASSTSLAFANEAPGSPIVSYGLFSGKQQGLKVASLVNGTWSVQTPISASTPGTGGYTSLVVDNLGNPSVAFYNTLDGSAQFVSRTGAASWGSVQTIESGDAVSSPFQKIYVKDVSALDGTGSVFLVGYSATADCTDPSIVEIGASVYVSFTSAGADLVTGVSGQQIYVSDLAGAVQVVSSNSLGAIGDDASALASFSQDGSAIAFQSKAGNLGNLGSNGFQQIYVKSWSPAATLAGVNTGSILAVSTSVDGTGNLQLGSGDSQNAKLNASASKVLFTSAATNLIASDTNGQIDLFQSGTAVGQLTPKLVSNSVTGEQALRDSGVGVFNPLNDNQILYTSLATNILGAQAGVYVISANGSSAEAIKFNGYQNSNLQASLATSLSTGFSESNPDLIVFDATAPGDATVPLPSNGVTMARPLTGGDKQSVSSELPAPSFGGYESSFELRAGHGGNSYLGNGGNGGRVGEGGITTELDDNGNEIAVSSIKISQSNVSITGGTGGWGGLSGGNGGSISGLIANAGFLNLSGGNGGAGLFAAAGNGGSISGFRAAAPTSIITAGDGGIGQAGGAGGAILGGGDSKVVDVSGSSFAFETGAGGQGISKAGAGGNIRNLVLQLNTSLVENLSIVAGHGGSAAAGPGGVGGSILNTIPYPDVNTFTGNVGFQSGDGGAGLSGGKGGDLNGFINSATGSNILSSMSFIAGNGGDGITLNGGAGGLVSKVTANGNGAGFDAVTGQPLEFSRYVAGEGGDSFGATGGNGGAVSLLNSTTNASAMVVFAGAGGMGLRQGGLGGGLSNLTVNAGGQALETAKLTLFAGAGGNAYSAAPETPANKSPLTVEQRILNVQRFGQKDGIGGNGGSISAISQPTATLTKIDLTAGNGGSVVNAGSPNPELNEAIVGRGGSISGVKLTTDIGDIRPDKVIKPYASDFLQSTVLGNPSIPLTSDVGNVGLVAGAAGRVQGNQSSPTGQNGSVSDISARNIMSMVAGSVDNISKILTLGKVEVNIGGILGAYKNAPVPHASDGAPVYLSFNPVETTKAPVNGGGLMDGAIFASKSSNDLSGKRVFIG